MNQIISTIIMDKIFILMSASSERLGHSFERYPVQSLSSSNDVTRLESIASIYRAKEASTYLLKLREECLGLNAYDKGRYIYNILATSKIVAADAPEYNALAIYIALNDFSGNEGVEYIYRAVISDNKFYYHEFCIIGYLGFSPGVNSRFDTLPDIYRNFTGGVGVAKLPWIVDATFHITARLDHYCHELYRCLMQKKISNKIFSRIVPFMLGEATFRQFKDLENYRNKDNYYIGSEISPIHYYNLMMNSQVIIHQVSKKSTESSLINKSFL